jgi:hypothetical protein
MSYRLEHTEDDAKVKKVVDEAQDKSTGQVRF